FLDVVGMQLLVEVDDIVVFLFGFGLGRFDEHARDRHDCVYQFVVDLVVFGYFLVVEDVFVLDDELVVEELLVNVLFVEHGLVLEVVFTHFQVLSCGGSGQVSRRVTAVGRDSFPRSRPVGGAEYNAASVVPKVLPGALGRSGPGGGRTGRKDRWGRWLARSTRRQTGYRNVL